MKAMLAGVVVFNVAAPGVRVAQSGRQLLRLTDVLRGEAALELGTALDGVSTKRITAAGVPGAGAYGLSRASNGSSSNPLFRIAALFVLMKKLGLPRSWAQRVIDWQQDLLDRVYGPVKESDLQSALDTDQKIDTSDDHARFMASHGCVNAARELLRASEEVRAHKRTLCLLLRQRIGEAG